MRTILASLQNTNNEILPEIKFWCPNCSDEIHLKFDDQRNCIYGSITICHKCGEKIHIPKMKHFLKAIDMAYNGLEQHYIISQNEDKKSMILEDGYEATVYRKGNIIEIFKPNALTWLIRILLMVACCLIIYIILLY